MSLALVIAGNHGQFTDWLHLVYGRRHAIPFAAPRYVAQADELWGIQAEHVDAFHLVGTYWEHLAWGSEPYLLLMEGGRMIGKAWAMDWETDFRMATIRRDPLTEEEMAATRRRLIEMEAELSDG